ncbi:hypothetical protein WN51_14181 [Melipona quadrifasciata]|uniref:Uncharacterized protein n=1 Tax=Melipona quadrifasciata TaxID=166423 RepID=A0A0N1ITJ2_9HYME|nr:hypothetical protein WN51_14181 [Melipona quadrifasciata]
MNKSTNTYKYVVTVDVLFCVPPRTFCTDRLSNDNHRISLRKYPGARRNVLINSRNLARNRNNTQKLIVCILARLYIACPKRNECKRYLETDGNNLISSTRETETTQREKRRSEVTPRLEETMRTCPFKLQNIHVIRAKGKLKGNEEDEGEEEWVDTGVNNQVFMQVFMQATLERLQEVIKTLFDWRNLILMWHQSHMISYRRVQKKKKTTNYRIRFGHSLWSANQLPAQGSEGLCPDAGAAGAAGPMFGLGGYGNTGGRRPAEEEEEEVLEGSSTVGRDSIESVYIFKFQIF